MAGIMWVYNAEIANSDVLALSTIANWTGYLIIVLMYPIMVATLNASDVFFVYAGFNLIFLIFQRKYVFETNRLNPNQIEDLLV
jgi:hypothetical protein